jgi:GntR family transcriptional regulator
MADPPLYAQIEQQLMTRIQRDYRTGDLLPTQKELAEEFGASLITVKRALGDIVRGGHLESTRGRGTVVVRPVLRDDRANVASWTDAMTGMGRQPNTASLHITVRIPKAEVARALGLKAREKTVLVERLRTLDGDPICLMTNELPLKLVPDLPREGLSNESLYSHLRHRYGIVPHRAEEEVEARLPTRPEVKALGSDTKIVMVVQRVTFTAAGKPIERAYMIAPAHRYRYRVEIAKK